MIVAQLPLHHLKRIALTLAFLEAFPKKPIRSGAERPPSDYGPIVESIAERLSTHPCMSFDVGHSLDADLRQVVSDTAREFADLVARYPTALGQPFERFASTIERLSCQACAAAAVERCRLAVRVCTNDPIDAALAVEYGGHCIPQIRALCETSLDIARAYYERFAPTTQDYVVRFGTRWLNDDDSPANMPPEIQATGGVDLHPGASVVELSIKPRRFDRATYQALFYILLHECICHVFQGSVDATGARAIIGNADLFAEGWMDYVTRMIFIQAISGVGPFGKRWAASVPRDPGVENSGLNLHEYRTHEWRPGLNRQLHKGKEAALYFKIAVAELLPSEDPDVRLVELSLQVNRLPLTRTQREMFVHTVNEVVFGPGRVNDDLATDILTGFVHGGWTAQDVVNACLAVY